MEVAMQQRCHSIRSALIYNSEDQSRRNRTDEVRFLSLFEEEIASKFNRESREKRTAFAPNEKFMNGVKWMK